MEKWVIITLFFTAQDFDRVEQPSGGMTANEADQVTLICNYTTKTTNADVYLFWYKQLPNKSPIFILNKYTFSEGITEQDFKKRFSERFSGDLNTISKSFPLTIQDVSVSDSAVYYCCFSTGLKLHKNSHTLISLNNSNQIDIKCPRSFTKTHTLLFL
uniref:Ig-like domain-containing protein n=1 Tax=Sinocyclocheilus rhinocerous TaxID=307959 RepID=A0A673J911_9TELE